MSKAYEAALEKEIEASEPEFVVKIRFGEPATRADIYTGKIPYDEYSFKTNDEANAFLKGVDAMAGWLDYEQVHEEEDE